MLWEGISHYINYTDYTDELEGPSWREMAWVYRISEETILGVLVLEISVMLTHLSWPASGPGRSLTWERRDRGHGFRGIYRC